MIPHGLLFTFMDVKKYFLLFVCLKFAGGCEPGQNFLFQICFGEHTFLNIHLL